MAENKIKDIDIESHYQIDLSIEIDIKGDLRC